MKQFASCYKCKCHAPGMSSAGLSKSGMVASNEVDSNSLNKPLIINVVSGLAFDSLLVHNAHIVDSRCPLSEYVMI